MIEFAANLTLQEIIFLISISTGYAYLSYNFLNGKSDTYWWGSFLIMAGGYFFSEQHNDNVLYFVAPILLFIASIIINLILGSFKLAHVKEETQKIEEKQRQKQEEENKIKKEIETKRQIEEHQKIKEEKQRILNEQKQSMGEKSLKDHLRIITTAIRSLNDNDDQIILISTIEKNLHEIAENSDVTDDIINDPDIQERVEILAGMLAEKNIKDRLLLKDFNKVLMTKSELN